MFVGFIARFLACLLFNTANGPYFENAVRVMSRTVVEAEQSRNYNLLVRSML